MMEIGQVGYFGHVETGFWTVGLMVEDGFEVILLSGQVFVF